MKYNVQKHRPAGAGRGLSSWSSPACCVAEARAAWEAEQEVPEEEVAEPSAPEEARRLAEEREALLEETRGLEVWVNSTGFGAD